MSPVPAWRLAGDWFDICSCNIPCPCEFAQAPTNNACTGMLAWHAVRTITAMSGSTVLTCWDWVPSKAMSGPMRARFASAFLSTRADEGQRQALQMIFGGHVGGWPAIFATKIGEFRGVEFVPIEFEVADDLAGERISTAIGVAFVAVGLLVANGIISMQWS
jgi:hypothetical protein